MLFLKNESQILKENSFFATRCITGGIACCHARFAVFFHGILDSSPESIAIRDVTHLYACPAAQLCGKRLNDEQ